MERLILCLWAFVCLGCGEAVTASAPTPDPVLMVMQGPQDGTEAPAEEQPTAPATSEEATEEDPYIEYESWCEAIHKQTCECPTRDPITCKKPKEPCPDDRTGKAQQCIRPGWARREGSNVYVCDPGWLNRRQQTRQREGQRIIVDAVCEWPRWAEELSQWGLDHKYGGDPSKLCWHLPGNSKALKVCRRKHFCQPDKLAKLLALVAARESTWNNNTSHELNFDIKANQQSYAKARRKGWYEDNPHFNHAERWQRGYGWYGFNAALHVFYWDNQAPPELLCRQVESTEIYLRKARRSFRKLWDKYGDNTERVYTLDTGEKVIVKGVTWYDIHRAASSGKLEPEKVLPTRRWSEKKQKWVARGFVGRARSKRIKLDPFETVMWEMLGEPIPKERQNEVAEEIRQEIRNYFGVQAANGAPQPNAAMGG